MKVIRCILKLAAIVAAVAAVICLIQNYRDTIENIFYTVVGKIKEKKEQYSGFTIPTEYNDYADGDLN